MGYSFISCGVSEVNQKLRGADSVIVNFYEKGGPTISKSVATTDESAISRLTEFISTKKTELYKCGSDGNILFFEKGKQVSDVGFLFTQEDCRHFLMDIKGELTSTKMTREGADFLQSLRDGRNTY
jgi:hypothetical protein